MTSPRILLSLVLVAALIALHSVGRAANQDFTRGYQAWDLGDYATARRHLLAAAKAGDLDAQNHLGQMEEDGQGSPVNLKLAVRWYRQAADAGHPAAQLNLGRMYRSGKGVAQSDSEAVAWYQKAADQGLSIAQFFMGLMYDTGKGVPSDYTQAYKWFDLAARQGDEDARYKRDRLARQMTPSQILAAERLAADFLGEAPPAEVSASTAQQGGRELSGGEQPASQQQIALARPADEAVLVPSNPAPVQAPVSPPLSAEQLAELQKLMNSLGYHAGTPGRNDAARIDRAIALFSRDTGFQSADGGRRAIDQALLAELQYIRVNLPPEAARPKSSSELVTRIQTALNALGYEAGTADGIIGRNTIKAARKYRADLGYKVRDELTQGLLRVTETRLAVIRHARTNGTRTRAAATLAQAAVSQPAPAPQPKRAQVEPAPTGALLVKRIQESLQRLGYEPGPADGAIGSRTRTAIRKFQSASGIEQDGRATVSLLASLDSDRAGSTNPGPRLRFVRPASQRELVRRAQVRLNSLGYSAGAPDGLAGSKTTSAVKAFQGRARLRADGRLTEDLLKRLEQPNAVKPAGKRRNLSGAQLVREIQNELNRLGYPAGTADGIIGRRTVDAARAYQRDVGLATNGKLTPALLQSLRAAR
ncbi:MAG: SEL1-like repeat protein [Pseudomonadota bacterium]